MRRRAGRYDRPVNFAEHPVIASLTPVFLLIGAGFLAGRRNWIRDSAVKDLSNLVFLLLIPSVINTIRTAGAEAREMIAFALSGPAALAFAERAAALGDFLACLELTGGLMSCP